MYFKSTITCIILFLCSQVFAQEFKLGKVSREELEQKSHPEDPDASAAILYKKGVTTIKPRVISGWVVSTEVVVRTKIYNKKGYEKATIKIPFYDWNNIDEEVEILDAATYNLENDKIKKTSLKRGEGIFIEDVSHKRKVKKIVMPNVNEGSIIEYKYILKSLYVESLPDWYFQYDIPVNEIEYNIWIPQFLIYNRILNQSVIEISETDGRQKNSASFEGFYKIVYHETGKFYKATNVPAYKEESYVDNISNYLPYVKYELSGSKSVKGIKKKYVSDWQSIAAFLGDDESFGLQIKQFDYFKKDIDSLLININTRDDKVTSIFNYVRNRMVWNESYGYDCVKGTEYAYSAKTGNSGEINLMLVAMLQYVGINAYPVILSTRSNGITSFHSLQSYNYVIAGLESMGDIVLLDATDKEATPGVVPLRVLNGFGQMIKSSYKVEEVNLQPAFPSKENIVIIAELDKDGALSGQLKTQYFDYNAYLFRQDIQNIAIDAFVAEKESELGNIEISDYKRDNIEVNEKPVIETFSFTSRNSCEVIGNNLYLLPMLFYTLSENPFKEEKRLYPINFIYPRQDRYIINIKIPEGYSITDVPESVNWAMGDNIAAFSYTISISNNQISILVTKNINLSKIDPVYYDTLKLFYTDMLKKQTEKIVLKKIE